MSVVIREDLAEAHRLAWNHLAQTGHWFRAAERIELAKTVLLAVADDDPLPPWVPVSTSDRIAAERVAPDVAHDIAYRLGRHAGTMTESIARAAMDVTGPMAYVELCAIASSVAAVAHFCRNAGIEVPLLPEPTSDAEPTRDHPTLATATLNWVPVAEPADQTAAVLQAYTGLPREAENTWRMASAQYMPAAEMIRPDWTRRANGLSRAHMELVAARVAQLRECFY